MKILFFLIVFFILPIAYGQEVNGIKIQEKGFNTYKFNNKTLTDKKLIKLMIGNEEASEEMKFAIKQKRSGLLLLLPTSVALGYSLAGIFVDKKVYWIPTIIGIPLFVFDISLFTKYNKHKKKAVEYFNFQ